MSKESNLNEHSLVLFNPYKTPALLEPYYHIV